MRVFIAINPPEEIRQGIDELKNKVGQLDAVKWVEKENIHITLKFFGEINDTMLDKVKLCLEGIKVSSFKVKLYGLGVFPNINNARVIWIGIKEGAEE